MTKAVLFSTSRYPRCSRAKRYLKDKGVPAVKIGSGWIVGFDRHCIDRALTARQ